jgi:A/G-specific adenine glycosylase
MKRRRMGRRMLPAELAPRLLPWFETHGRRGLPWQRDPTPYRVWVSEVMLQQTQVETVVPYFTRFVARFPDVALLAAACLDEVLALWSGLGYYARGRNLHRAAQEVVARHGGVLPQTLEALMALPGIGRSTAGAILALALGQRHPILDGNVKRVLSRAFAVRDAAGSAAVFARLWDLAEACTPATQVAAYTQAIMDLGATLCTRAQPACDRCPFGEGCAARAMDLVAALPARRMRAPRRRKRTQMVFVLYKGSLLLQRRPDRGIWGGLWSPPEFTDARTARRWWQARFGTTAGKGRRLPALRHTFTHFDLDIEPWVIELKRAWAAGEEAIWQDLSVTPSIGLPAPVSKLIEEAFHGEDSELRAARPRGGRPGARALSG